jgi:hypothetical protein
MTMQPLWYYQWVPGVTLKNGAIVRPGQTLYGPVVPLPRR